MGGEMKLYDEKINMRNERYLIREVENSDKEDLLKVYGDRNALPFFNSDNCNGDNFYYDTSEKMQKAIEFWKYSKENKWFKRLTIVNLAENKIVGTVELCYRGKDDFSDETGILRVDVSSAYENKDDLSSIFRLIVPASFELLECSVIITKIPVYAVERAEAALSCGVEKTDILLTGHDGYKYNGYWKITL